MASIPYLGLCVIFATLKFVVSAPFDEVQCGTSDYPGSHVGERIVHGALVPQGKYPWLVQLDFCTATILSQRFVLTTARCLLEYDPSVKMNVIVGSVNRKDGQKIRVKRIIKHPFYDPRSLPNDIGIIELQEELNFTKDIRPICLSGKPQVGDPDKNVVITGWGGLMGDENRTDQFPDLLHEGTARILNDEKCNERYTLPPYNNETSMCIGSHNNTAPWNGDTGGPLLLHEGNRWTQIGITSDFHVNEHGIADLTWPSVYTRISHFCEWIAENTNNEAKCDVHND